MRLAIMRSRRVIAMSLIAACAQASPPPGGTPDKTPPRIESTSPAQNAIGPYAGDVVFKFDETLSERGARPSEIVLVSPETGKIRADRRGRELKVGIEGGWHNGLVYHVTVLPGLQDRFGNARAEAYELVFSTGPQILPTVIGGVVLDRLTGRAVSSARVVAVGLADSVAYTTLTDTAGFFALRSLPLGGYSMTAHVDLNRNRKIDGVEPRDVKIATLVTPRDTPVVEFSVLAADTTPARLLRAEARDSMQIRVTFDDFIAETEQLGSFGVSFYHLPDSTMVGGGRMLRVREFESIQRAAADTTGRASVARDTARVLPVQELVIVPNTALQPGGRYRVQVSNVRNIAGIAGGGGNVAFSVPARPRAAPARPDSASKPIR